jgi:hypothetical protein
LFCNRGENPTVQAGRKAKKSILPLADEEFPERGPFCQQKIFIAE